MYRQLSATQFGNMDKQALSQRRCKPKALRAFFFFILLAWLGLLIARSEVIRAVLPRWATQRPNLGRIIISIPIVSNGFWLRTVLLIHTSYHRVSNIIRKHIDNRMLLLICILLLSHSLIFFRFLFYKNMVVIYVFLSEEAMYSNCCLCILIVSLRILIVVYVLSMYS